MISLLVFLIIALVHIDAKMLLHSTQGEVHRENFTYYSLNYNGHITMILNTLDGDADLYISEKHLFPTYDPEKYDLHSATCGLDVVNIPKSFQRPIGVGIFGHSGYEKSTYVLEVFLNEQGDDIIEPNEESTTIVAENEHSEEQKSEKKNKIRLKSVITKSGLWAFVELFEILFL